MRFLKWLLLIVIVVVIANSLVRREEHVNVEEGSVLMLDIQGDYVEAPEPSMVMRLIGRGQEPFAGLLDDLSKAERDARITGLVLRIRELGIGWAKVQELRGALERLAAAGKQTVAYLEVEQFGANKELYLATAAQEVILAPGTRSPLVGLAAEYFFLGGLWEKLGVELEVERMGKYKSAAESLARKEMSEPAREMAESMLASLDDGFVSGMARSRGLSEAQVRLAIDEAPVVAARLEQLGLIDGVRFLDEVLSGTFKNHPIIEGEDYARVDPADVGFSPVAQIALVYGAGGVTRQRSTGPSRGPSLNADEVVSILEEVAKDPKIDAIIFRIDSPGGSALASELVWRAVRQAREHKPVVASFSDLAASGGYYVACGADAIVAEPATLTGSIGVFALRPVLGGLLTKLGIGFDSLEKGKHAGVLLSTKPLSEDARARFHQDIVAAYQLFLARVAEGRGLSTGKVDDVAQGRVWTGQQALTAGLIDEIGGLHEATQRVKKLLKLDPKADVALLPYPQPKPLALQLAQALGGGVSELLPPQLRKLAELSTLVPEGTPAALPPIWVEIH